MAKDRKEEQHLDIKDILKELTKEDFCDKLMEELNMLNTLVERMADVLSMSKEVSVAGQVGIIVSVAAAGQPMLYSMLGTEAGAEVALQNANKEFQESQRG